MGGRLGGRVAAVTAERVVRFADLPPAGQEIIRALWDAAAEAAARSSGREPAPAADRAPVDGSREPGTTSTPARRRDRSAA